MAGMKFIQRFRITDLLDDTWGKTFEVLKTSKVFISYSMGATKFGSTIVFQKNLTGFQNLSGLYHYLFSITQNSTYPTRFY
jgi:hypothetical protein